MILTIITFFIILGIIVLVHELGHFFTARAFGVKVEEFGFGMPPRLGGFVKDENNKWKFVKGKEDPSAYRKTVWSINWLPIGGFVRIKGENGENKLEEDSFGHKRSLPKAIILSAGVLTNFLLCFILFAIVFFVGLPMSVNPDNLKHTRAVTDNKMQVVSVNAGSPAENAGIKIGDGILKLDNQQFVSIEEIQNYSAGKEGLLMQVEIDRQGEIISKDVIPQVLDTSNNQAVMGIGLDRTAKVAYTWYQSIWLGIKNTGYLIWAILVALFTLFKNIITTGQVSTELTGPVGIAVMTGQIIKLGFIYLLQFTAVLSVNLGIINILPIPALDGGRLLFIAIEKIRGKNIDQKIEATIHTVGFAVLMILIVLVTYRDIARWGGQIIERII